MSKRARARPRMRSASAGCDGKGKERKKLLVKIVNHTIARATRDEAVTAVQIDARVCNFLSRIYAYNKWVVASSLTELSTVKFQILLK